MEHLHADAQYAVILERRRGRRGREREFKIRVLKFFQPFLLKVAVCLCGLGPMWQSVVLAQLTGNKESWNLEWGILSLCSPVWEKIDWLFAIKSLSLFSNHINTFCYDNLLLICSFTFSNDVFIAAVTESTHPANYNSKLIRWLFLKEKALHYKIFLSFYLSSYYIS